MPSRTRTRPLLPLCALLPLSLTHTQTLTINFSSRTSSLDVQRVVEANVEKRPANTFGPPPNKKLLIFVDDLNMPQVDTYGTQQPLALLKFLIEVRVSQMARAIGATINISMCY